MIDLRLCGTRLGMPFFFRFVATVIRSSFGIWSVRCGLFRAHLVSLKSAHEVVYGYLVVARTYSNFRAAIELGNPETIKIIFQGRRLSRDVRAAPPLVSPLCCLSLLGGLGVDPTYIDAGLTVERKT